MSILKMRIRNCIQTLLEMQPALSRGFRINLAADFLQLEKYLSELDTIQVGEEDVLRMERLTADFLRQVRMGGARAILPAGRLQ